MLHRLVLPELDLPDTTVTASLWLVRRGSIVREGDRLLEVLAGEVTVDLPSPADGILRETCVVEDQTLVTGQLLAVIENDDA